MNFRKAVAILLLFLAFAAVHLYIYVQNIRLKYQITDAKIIFNELNSQNRLLGSQVSRDENLSVIEKLAKEKLGMVYPDDLHYVLPR